MAQGVRFVCGQILAPSPWGGIVSSPCLATPKTDYLREADHRAAGLPVSSANRYHFAASASFCPTSL